MGFADGEAANLTALAYGFGISSQPWTVSELTHLLFLRELGANRHRWSRVDDRAGSADGTPATVRPEPPATADGAPQPVAGSTRRVDADPSDGRVTLLMLFRSMAGPTATLDLFRPSAGPRPDAPGGVGREGG
jgi:hypothetical protein